MNLEKIYKALYRCAKNDYTVLSGIYHEAGQIIATDAYALLLVKITYPKELEGTAIDRHNNTIVTKGGKPCFPPYQKVIPANKKLLAVDTDFETAYGACQKLPNDIRKKSVLVIGDVNILADDLAKVLNVFKISKEEPCIYRYKDRLWLTSEHVSGLILGRSQYFLETFNPEVFTIEEALQYNRLK